MAFVDEVIGVFDRALRSVAGVHHTVRPSPGDNIAGAELSDAEREHAAALMRVNHVGEVCAQALYEGQALAARSPRTRDALVKAAEEERDHLVWCATRIRELGGRTSLLNPAWYAGSFALGLTASMLGDRWSMAFLAETERQVEAHLAGHLVQLAPQDRKTRVVVEAMREDEARHRETAVALGATELPPPVRLAMRVMSRVMTTVSYRV